LVVTQIDTRREPAGNRDDLLSSCCAKCRFPHRDRETQEMLPAVTFVGRFESAALQPDEWDANCSVLNIVWFESELAAMFSGASLAGMRTVAWETLARDGTW
jgi:hypothetical protein